MQRSAVALAVLLSTAGFACGGDVVGVGNSANRIMLDAVAGELAEALAEHPDTPQVSGELVREIYARIVEQARDGDLQASLVILELAAIQREASE